ncbi:hypothetical protein EAE91_16325 [Photorhabdus noenieputensis]|uniref:YdiH family protein n=1 Tax=Photorhabdus noenieputensis TaxID=1208607 RepID=UPI001BD2380D|nr:YdiH family protein [Photorhabdus noenieputensis]MBS9438654.1 hypothetical protein [Photorhabdus noenieputensis]MCK3670937.1 hypothetical protein [Photorhabdus noenieputensis]
MTDAQTLAFEYLRRSDKKLSPAEYLLALRKLEAEFTELLQVDDLEQKLKDDSIRTWKALSKSQCGNNGFGCCFRMFSHYFGVFTIF